MGLRGLGFREREVRLYGFVGSGSLSNFFQRVSFCEKLNLGPGQPQSVGFRGLGLRGFGFREIMGLWVQ